jgi:hypothetical protein
MVTGNDLRFVNIVFFFLGGIFLFGLLYSSIYDLSPSSFRYPDALVIPKPILQNLNLATRTLFQGDFLLYSACTAVSLGYPRIMSASAVVSALNFLEVVGTLLIISLLIATFVGRAGVMDDDRNIS